MSNKFSEQIKNKSLDKPKVTLKDLLVDSGTEDLIHRAKSEGRFLSLPASAFVPDPNQPRKTFDQDSIDELQLSMEAHGQLQPILVGDKLSNGLYPIIAGERRWRAISNSKIINSVDAIVRFGYVDELNLLLLQIDENNKRQQIPAMENAMAMKRVLDICRAEGKDQTYAAKILNISASHLSKLLSLLTAPGLVTDLSLDGETQDVEVLYSLSKTAKKNPEDVELLVKKLKEGSLDTGLRQASKDLADKTKEKKLITKTTVIGQKITGNSEAVVASDISVSDKPQKASSVRLDLTDDDFTLTVIIDNKPLRFEIDIDTVDMLKVDLEKHWGL